MLREHGDEGASRSWSSRTSTWPTRRPSTWSASSRAGCARSAPWWWPPTATTALAENRALRVTLGRRLDAAVHAAHRPAAAVLVRGHRAERGQSGHDAASVHALTGGNPFFVTEVLRGETDELPASARDAVLARAARLLGPGAARCSTRPPSSASAWSPTCSAAVTGADTCTLDEPVAAGLLVADGRGPAVPPRDRPACGRAGDRPRTRHRRCTGRILAELERVRDRRRRPPGPPRRRCARRGAAVRHARRGRRPVRGAGVAPRGGRAVPRGRCASWHRPSRWSRAELLDALAASWPCWTSGQPAAEALEESVALWRAAGGPLREGDALRRLSRGLLAAVPGTRESTQRSFRALCGPRAARTVARAGLGLRARPASTWPTSTREESIAFATPSARAWPTRSDLRRRCQRALNTLSCVAYPERRRWYGWIRRLSTSLSPTATEPGRPRVREPSHAAVRRDEVRRGGALLPRGIGLLRRARPPHLRQLPAREASEVLAQTGRWHEVEAISAEPLIGGTSSPINRITFLVPLGKVRSRRRGRRRVGASRRGRGVVRRRRRAAYGAFGRSARAEARWLAGDQDAAEDELDEGAPSYAASVPHGAPERGRAAVADDRRGGPEADDLPRAVRRRAQGRRARGRATLGRGRPALRRRAWPCSARDDEPDVREALERFDALGADARRRDGPPEAARPRCPRRPVRGPARPPASTRTD